LKNLVKIFFLFSTILIWNINAYSQEVPHSIKNTGVYDFLDELANSKIIEINSAIKPYSRMLIAKKLKEADEKRDQLNARQQKELDFYMKDFGKEVERRNALPAVAKKRRLGTTAQRRKGFGGGWPEKRLDLFYYEDSLFSVTINPILGGELFTNSSGQATYWRNGLEARGYIGKWGFYASLRDNHEKPLLGKPEYLTQREGGNIKNGSDWSKMQGGVTYSWKWGDAGLVKDAMQWGNNYNMSNIIRGYNPTFVQVKLHISPVKWFDFNYFHGWLDSRVVDSTESFWVTTSNGPEYRKVYHKKFQSANMFTFTPFRQFNISFGNSIVYDYDNVNPAYLIPVFFYKSVDHSQTMGINNMNSQMFFDISSRQIKNLHLYASLFVDEFSSSRIGKDYEWNFFSYKAGFRLSNFPLSNLSFTSEFTYTYPLTFRHYIPTITFETANFNMGHYLKDNAREWYLAFDYKPLRATNIRLWFSDAVRGPDYTETGGVRAGEAPLQSIEWQNTSVGLKISYQVINDVYTWFTATYSEISGDERWSPEYFYGYKTTLNAGVTVGF